MLLQHGADLRLFQLSAVIVILSLILMYQECMNVHVTSTVYDPFVD